MYLYQSVVHRLILVYASRHLCHMYYVLTPPPFHMRIGQIQGYAHVDMNVIPQLHVFLLPLRGQLAAHFGPT